MRENEAEDKRCLANVEEHIENQSKLGIPVAGMMVEPIQAEGGDYHGSKEFFQVHHFPFLGIKYSCICFIIIAHLPKTNNNGKLFLFLYRVWTRFQKNTVYPS